MSKKKVSVLDSTAFYAGIPFIGAENYFSTSRVVKEVSHRRVERSALKTLVESGRLRIQDPSKEALNHVKKVASKSRDIVKLSQTDLSVAALAFELLKSGLNVAIISDDYSVQNLSKLVGVEVSPIMTRGISRTVTWMIYCSGCGKIFTESTPRRCDVCGTQLKMKFLKKNKVKTNL